MKEKLPLFDQRIIDCLNTDYGINVASLMFLPWGADMNASVYKALSHDQISYFVKLKRGHHHELSFAVAKYLQEAKIPRIIPIICTKEQQLSQHIEDFTLIVYPYIEGKDGFSRGLSDGQWITLGKAMRQVHDIHIPLSMQNQIRQETFLSTWRDAVRSLYVIIEARASDDEIAYKLLTFMKEKINVIHQLVDTAEELAQQLKEQSLPFVFCHSDIHGGNVLINNKEELYIVDWDEPIMAPKERDLMFIGGGVANLWNQPYEEALFYEGYGKSEVNKEILAYYRHERIVEDIAEYGRTLLLTAPKGADRVVMYQHFIDMFKPRGVVDMAFQTRMASTKGH
jgi:spectinomycin phosphotransferase